MMLLLCVLATVLSPGLAHVLEMPTSAPTNGSDIWAVLVAGSSGWMNYRHQADVCHAYQILHAHGVPDDHIIVMMMDDIANNEKNPTPGTIINRPNGPDVYHGVPKDYVGAAVTPQNFLQIITGNATGLDKVGSGKVLKSGPNDHVFINMVGMGAQGIFGFPFQPHLPGHQSTLPILMATDFLDAIKNMDKTNMYKEMVIYLESAESGSMFKSILPEDINVYAMSASNATESSYACYLDKSWNTMLGDVFSVKWMENTDRENVTSETIHHQFEKVRLEVTTSHVNQWGNEKISAELLSLFFGSKSTDLEDSWGPFPSDDDPCLKSSVPTQHVPLILIEEQILEAQVNNNEDDVSYWKLKLHDVTMSRLWMNAVIANILSLVTNDEQVTERLMYGPVYEIENWSCYGDNLQVLNDKCFDIALNPYAYRYMQQLINLCELGYDDTEAFADAVRTICIHPPIYGIV